MALSLKAAQFKLKFAVRTLTLLRSPKTIGLRNLELPIGAVLHHHVDTPITLTAPLLRTYDDLLGIYHLDTLIIGLGNARRQSGNIDKSIRQFHKVNRRFKRIRKLVQGVSRERDLLIIHYPYADGMYRYTRTNLSAYNEWMNIRTTMWNEIAEMDGERIHFIPMSAPSQLPSRSVLKAFLTTVTPVILTKLNDTSLLELLEVWRIIHTPATAQTKVLLDSDYSNVYYSWVVGDVVVNVNLADIRTWVSDDTDTTANAFYVFWDYLISLRTIVESVVATDVDGIGHDKITADVAELGVAGRLSAAEQRGLVSMSGRYKVLPEPFTGGTVTVADIIEADVSIDIKPVAVVPDSLTIPEPSMLYSSITQLDSQYIKERLNRDILRTIMKLQSGGVIVKNIKSKDVISAVTRKRTISVQTQPLQGASSTFHFTIPILDSDGSFLTGNRRYRLERQRGEVPLLKTAPHQVGITSYFGKLFIFRNVNSSVNYSKWIAKILSVRGADDSDDTVTDLVYGSQTWGDQVLPRAFTAVGMTFISFTGGLYAFNWDIRTASDRYTPDELKVFTRESLTPCGRMRKDPIGMDTHGLIYVLTSGKSAIPQGYLSQLIEPGLTTGPIEYSTVTIYNARLPLIIFFMYIQGLDRSLAKLLIPYKTVPVNERVKINPDVYILKLKDVKYVIDISDPAVRLLVGGLRVLRKVSKGYTVQQLNARPVYNTILNGLGVNRSHQREIHLMIDMFIDPITGDRLKYLKLPDTIEGLLIHANGLLVNDAVPANPGMIIKGYERMSGLLYTELLRGIRTLRARGNVEGLKYSIPPSAVWLAILQDQSQATIEESNPIQALKESEAITFSGAGGRSVESMVKNTRGFSEVDLGVISEASPDSYKVGVRTFAAPDANITNHLGIPGVYDATKQGPASVISTSAMLAPGVTHDDGKRVNFISIQNSHTTATTGDRLPPFRTGYEQVIAGRVGPLYATVADQDGQVVNVDDRVLTVQYADGQKVSIELGTAYGTVGNTTVPHAIRTDLVKGQKFKAKNTLTYNSGFFSPNPLSPGNVSFRMGNVAKIAFMESADTIEDGCTISPRLATGLETPVSKVRHIVIPVDSTIHNVVSVGDTLETDSILCTIEDAVSAALTDTTDAKIIKSLSNLSASNPESQASGICSKIEILYFPDSKLEPSDSIAELLKQDNNRRRRRTRILNTAAVTNEITESVRLGGKLLSAGQISIGFYIDAGLPMGTGDKLVVGNQLKSTSSRVLPEGILTESGATVDGTFGYLSVANRIVRSLEITGIANTVLETAFEQMLAIYNGDN